MGSIGSGNTAIDNRTPEQIYRDEHINMNSEVNKQFLAGNITREQRDTAISGFRKATDTIVKKMVNNFTDDTIKALDSTMQRKFILTSDSDITGAIELYKTPNGFVLNAPSTRSNFRAFMDNDGNIRRMPANEMKSAETIQMSGDTKIWLSNKFQELVKGRR